MTNLYCITKCYQDDQTKDDELGGLGHRWVDNIKMDALEVRCEDVDRIHMAQDSRTGDE
jgi:hypothetical protein